MKRVIAICLPLILLGISCGQAPAGGVFRSTDSGETWQQVAKLNSDNSRAGSIGDFNILALAFNPTDTNIIYAGTEGNGLYISLTGGELWFKSTITSGDINSIAVDPVDPNLVYLAKGSTIMKSVDQGLTWETVYTNVQNSVISVVAVDSFEHSRVYAADKAGNVVKSFDYGVNWDIRLQIGSGIKRFYIAKQDTRILYALTDGGDLYQSQNGGEFTLGEEAEDVNSGWKELTDKNFKKQFDGTNNIEDIYLDSNDNSVVYITAKRGLMRGTANGTDWSDIITLIGVDDDKNEQIKNIWTAPGKPNELYFTLGNALHKSVDSGVTWKVIDNFPSDRNILRFLIDPQTPNVMYAGMIKPEERSGLIQQP